MYEKYIKDGQVAVLYSPKYGAGWYSWNKKHEGLLFDKEIVQAVLDDNRELAAKIAQEKYEGCYTGGAKDLRIEWVEQGSNFEIDEYDGYEAIRYLGEINFLKA